MLTCDTFEEVYTQKVTSCGKEEHVESCIISPGCLVIQVGQILHVFSFGEGGQEGANEDTAENSGRTDNGERKEIKLARKNVTPFYIFMNYSIMF